jgi:hypothetical protein
MNRERKLHVVRLRQKKSIRTRQGIRPKVGKILLAKHGEEDDPISTYSLKSN